MLKTTKTPTIAAIEAAIAKADNMHGVYTCTPSATGQKGRYVVQHSIEYRRAYIVDAVEGTCTCPAFRRDKVCKHGAFVQQVRWMEEGEADAEARAEYAHDALEDWQSI